MPDAKRLRPKVQALQRDTASLLKLLGGNDNDQLRFWEILKGITTPAEYRLVDTHIDAMQNAVTALQTNLKGVEKAAKEIGAGAIAKAAGA